MISVFLKHIHILKYQKIWYVTNTIIYYLLFSCTKCISNLLHRIDNKCIFLIKRKKWGEHIKGFHCIRIRTRGGIYYEIWPEPKEVPEGAARVNFRGLRPCFIVYPDSSPNTDIIPFLWMINNGSKHWSS